MKKKERGITFQSPLATGFYLYKWMEMVRDRSLGEQVYILAGITPMRSMGMAKYLRRAVPGGCYPIPVFHRSYNKLWEKGEGASSLSAK